MATALKLEPAVCEHLGWNRYEGDDNSTDDTVTERGRCSGCGQFLELWISRTTGEIWSESTLDQATIARLRREVLES